MYKIGSCLLLSLVITLPAARASSENEPDEREAEARKLCDQFWQNFLQRDMNGVMKKVSVPFYEFSDGKSRVIRDKKKLRTRIDSHLPASEDPRQIKFVIKTVVRYSQLLESNPSALYEREQERRILGEVLRKDSLVLHQEVQRADGSVLDTIITLVTWRDGQARIVGVRD